MQNQKVTSHLNRGFHQWSFYWNLNSSVAAIFHSAFSRACQPSGMQSHCIDLGSTLSQITPSKDKPICEFEKTISIAPAAAVVIGIDPNNLKDVVPRIRELRDFCDRWPSEHSPIFGASTHATFILGWFPQADQQAVWILKEMGVDLVLYNPVNIQRALKKIAIFGHRSVGNSA